jgi:hypothetical protein
LQLIERLRRIHEVNFANDVGPFDTGRAQSYLAEDGFETDDDVPAWFRQMIELVDRRLGGRALFENNDGGTMSGLLQELHDTHGWDVDDYGEGMEMIFPVSKVRVFISRESLTPDGRGCHSYTVSVEEGMPPAGDVLS